MGTNVSHAGTNDCVGSKYSSIIPNSKVAILSIYSLCRLSSPKAIQLCSSCLIFSKNQTSATCDLLLVYQQLCQATPDLDNCRPFKEMCKTTPLIAYCNIQQYAMGMSFHTGIFDTILFEQLVPTTIFQYYMACIIIIATCCLHEFIIVYATILEQQWKLELTNLTTLQTNNSNSQHSKLMPDLSNLSPQINGEKFSHNSFGTKIAFYKSILKSFKVLLNYSLMLVAMTFNVGYFVSIVFGFGLGVFLFSKVESKIVCDDMKGGLDCCK
jgi:copper transporter 1